MWVGTTRTPLKRWRGPTLRRPTSSPLTSWMQCNLSTEGEVGGGLEVGGERSFIRASLFFARPPRSRNVEPNTSSVRRPPGCLQLSLCFLIKRSPKYRAFFLLRVGAEVSEVCLGCICEAISGCNRTLSCSGDVCGLFRITWAYWADSGKPVLDLDSPEADGAYARCVTDAHCAARAVRGYMAKFQQDCNGDRVVNCYDFARIHLLGGYGCGGGLTPLYQQRFENCVVRVNELGGAID
ncbi:hypothetical protein J437_LFUL008919 [Ladona fulva]|uniref:lysozyme n=1 Tax=Ladona fulva TaxID=123851 RepID=A0A8K0KC10_LADFU|nr:hypothetical protein J437_LFUL008919 [Ladona fulva]